MPSASSSAHILNIAYDRSLMDSRARILTSAGYTVESVYRKQDALRNVSATRFNLVLIGHSVPAPERDDIIELIRARDRSVPIAFVEPSTDPQSCASADVTISSRPADLLKGVKDAIAIPRDGPEGSVMHAARVIHFGADQAHRSQVLRSAGYEVEECATLPCLARVLRDGKVTDLICISEAQDQPAEGAVAFARGFDGTPLVLFRAANHAYLQRDWDLEVPTLTPPTEWLGEVAELIARSRTIRARPVGLQGNSRRLREVAEPALKRTRELRSDQERTRGGGRSQK